MLTKTEKKLMLLVNKLCGQKTKMLIPIFEFLVLFQGEDGSLDEEWLNESFLTLYKQEFLDFTISNSKNGKYVLVELKKKGIHFNNDIKREQKKVLLIILKTVLLALLSFGVTMFLRYIF